MSEPYSEAVQTGSVLEESAIVEPLIASSPAFRRFYETTRGYIPGPIVWRYDPAIRTEARADIEIQHGQTVQRAIRFKRWPLPDDDALLIAHELQHLRLEAAGWPGIVYNNEVEDGHLASAIHSMVEDLLVHPALITAGFDVQASMEAEWTRARDELEAIEAPPARAATALLWVANFASHVLDYHLLAQRQPDYPEPVYFAWADYTYPALMSEARDLAHMIEAFGYENPGKMGLLYKFILRRYGLTNLYQVF